MMNVTGIENSLHTNAINKENVILQQDFNEILRKANQEKKEKELLAACQQLEAVFINKVMESMRAAIPRSDLINRGFATDVWESMLYEEYAQQMSKTGTLGIGQMLYKQLSAQL